MKSSILATFLALGLSASAYRIEYGPNGSFKAYSDPKAPAADAHNKRLAARSGLCSPCRDKCVRAVVSASKATPDFCSSFLAETYTATEAFAPVQTQCADSAERVSAACSCFVQPVGSTEEWGSRHGRKVMMADMNCAIRLPPRRRLLNRHLPTCRRPPRPLSRLSRPRLSPLSRPLPSLRRPSPRRLPRRPAQCLASRALSTTLSTSAAATMGSRTAPRGAGSRLVTRTLGSASTEAEDDGADCFRCVYYFNKIEEKAA